MSTRITEIPYSPDTASRVTCFVDHPWAVFLDSGSSPESRGRYDIFAAEPSATLVTRGGVTEICDRDGCINSEEDPFDLLRRQLDEIQVGDPLLPFSGGAIGYFSYDLTRRLESLPSSLPDEAAIPEMAIGIYDWALVADHQLARSWLVTAGRDERTAERWNSLLEAMSQVSTESADQSFQVTGEIRHCSSFSEYEAAFEKVQQYITDGDCYQVNIAQRFEIPCSGDAWDAFQRLRRISSAPCSAYLNYPFLQVLSVSPERFLQVRDREVVTQPIKGTAPRAQNAEQDRLFAEQLSRSAKDRAENLMIVDLMRNDLSKSCMKNSVRVPKLFELQSFSAVHHLVSTVTGRLLPEADALSVLRGSFPGGSITGAPKIRAMEVIEELETHRRGIYCGSIGYVGFDGNMDSNIAIRTATVANGSLSYWAGGGIVSDSVLADEYQESLDKAAGFFHFVDSAKTDEGA